MNIRFWIETVPSLLKRGISRGNLFLCTTLFLCTSVKKMMIYCRKFDCHRDIRKKFGLYWECTKMHYLHNSHFKKYKNSFESMICYAPNNDSCDDVKLIVCDFDSNCKICNKVFLILITVSFGEKRAVQLSYAWL